MSLLMDALKKAEQEKKEAAKKRGNLPDESGFHLQQDNAGTTAPHTIPEETPQSETTPSGEDHDAGKSPRDLSLEPIDPGQKPPEGPAVESLPVLGVDEEGIQDATDTGDVTRQVERPALAISGEHKAPDRTGEQELFVGSVGNEPDPDSTFHGVDLEKTYSSQLYEDTLQGEPFKPEDIQHSYDETLPGVPAAQLAKDIGTQDQPTPVAAKTVFTATGTIAKPASGLKWVLVSLSVITVCLGVIYFYLVTPATREIPSPVVARGVETIISNAGVNNITPLPVTQAQPADTPTEPETSGTEPAAAGTGTDTQSGDIQTADSGSAEPEISTEDETVTDTATIGATGSEAAGIPDNESLPEVIKPPSSLIKISRSRQANSENELVQEAFMAYQAGDYSLAEAGYREALQRLPGNRDVLLGLAAVETRNGNTPAAMDIYLRLLRQNPLDNIARAAVLGYQRGNNTMESISAIKSMLSDAPDQPLLYFTLGKLYAARSNWSEAQQAFFDAYRLDSSNPDFALNLAVSLDRLGRTQTALDYYNVALELSGTSPAGFDSSRIRERINTLNRED